MGEPVFLLRGEDKKGQKHCSSLTTCEVVDETATIYWKGGVPIVTVCENGYLLNTDRERTEDQRMAINQILSAKLRIGKDWTVLVSALGQSVPFADGLFIPFPHLS